MPLDRKLLQGGGERIGGDDDNSKCDGREKMMGSRNSGEQQIQKLQQNWWQVRDNWRISVKTVG